MSTFSVLATRYLIVPKTGPRPPFITIQHRGLTGWAIVCEDDGYVLNRDGQWEYEPLPSNRSDEFLLRTRHVTPEDALAWYEHYHVISRGSGIEPTHEKE